MCVNHAIQQVTYNAEKQPAVILCDTAHGICISYNTLTKGEYIIFCVLRKGYSAENRSYPPEQQINEMCYTQ